MVSKASEQHWFDLFATRPTRRDFLRVGASAAGLVAMGTLPGCGRQRVRVSSDPFALGVASGDPSPDGVVLWSRLNLHALDGAAAAGPVSVAWEVAEDDGFGRVVLDGSVTALPELGHSVHVEAEGLGSGRDYWYRFTVGDAVSPVGRTRTAPPAGAPVERIRFAFASCQDYEHGYYTAFRHMADEDLDFVVHLGDYIYEKRFGTGAVREHEGGEVLTLDEYRGRYATYRGDPDLQLAHQAAPWIVTTDDHEVDNDYADDVAEDDQPREALLLRRAAAYQAFYEFMPIRRAAMPAGPDMLLYRQLPFGDLMDMRVLDTRQYRSPQPCGGGNSPTCPTHMSPHQTLLGAPQRDWLFEGLRESDAVWNVLAQQVMVARLARSGGETWAMDKWDGYPVERQRLLDLFAGGGVSNPVVLTGDIHANWVADLKHDFADPRSLTVGTEFIGTSISSGGDGQDTSSRGQETLDANPHLRFYNGQRGYVVADVTPDTWTSRYRIVPYVTRPGAPVETRATYVVEEGHPGALPG